MAVLGEQYKNFTQQLVPIKSWLDKTTVILQESDKLTPEQMISEPEITKYKVGLKFSIVGFLPVFCWLVLLVELVNGSLFRVI